MATKKELEARVAELEAELAIAEAAAGSDSESDARFRELLLRAVHNPIRPYLWRKEAKRALGG